jgi:hypothetical protein
MGTVKSYCGEVACDSTEVRSKMNESLDNLQEAIIAMRNELHRLENRLSTVLDDVPQEPCGVQNKVDLPAKARDRVCYSISQLTTGTDDLRRIIDRLHV